IVTSKPEAKDLLCIFDSLADKYSDSQLIQCEYFSELSLLLDSLENYLLYEKHYNQIIAKNSFINKLQENIKNKNNVELKTFSNFEVQVYLPNPKYEKLLNKINKLECVKGQLLSENELLKKKLNKRFNDQQDHIEAIINITKKE
ncbi:15119_t:CDS:2, partial [Cetraspora pellucida]